MDDVSVEKIFCVLFEISDFLGSEFCFKFSESFLEMKASSACIMCIGC